MFYLNMVLPLRPSKSNRADGWVWVWVAHKNLETAQSPNFSFRLGIRGLDLELGLGLGLVNLSHPIDLLDSNYCAKFTLSSVSSAISHF